MGAYGQGASASLGERRRTRQIRVGAVPIGGGAPIAVQSMTITDTRDVEATLSQIYSLAAVGCEIARLAVPDADAADALTAIKSRSPLPIVADIHFDHRLALRALEAGVDKLRINPVNIGSRERTRIVAREGKARGVPIRIGANIGSPSKATLRTFGKPCADALVESAMEDVRVLEDRHFLDIVISVKASDVPMMIDAYTKSNKAKAKARVEWRLDPKYWRSHTLDSDRRWTTYCKAATVGQAEIIARQLNITALENAPDQR